MKEGDIDIFSKKQLLSEIFRYFELLQSHLFAPMWKC